MKHKYRSWIEETEIISLKAYDRLDGLEESHGLIVEDNLYNNNVKIPKDHFKRGENEMTPEISWEGIAWRGKQYQIQHAKANGRREKTQLLGLTKMQELLKDNLMWQIL